MDDSNARFVACPACGRRFAWKPQLEGRKVACKCGGKFIASAQAPAEQSALAPSAPPVRSAATTGAGHAGRSTAVPPAAASAITAAAPPQPPAPAVAPGAPAAAPRTAAGIPDEMLVKYALTGRAGHKVEMEEGDDEGTIVSNLIIPLVMIAAGLFLWLGQAGYAAQDPTQSVPRLAAMVLLGLVLNVALMLGGCFLSAVMLNLTFGSLGRTVLKLAAIAILAGAVGSLIVGLDKDVYSIRGLVVAWHAVILIYFFAFSILFTLDLQENLFTVVIIGIMQAVAMLAVWST